MKREIICNDCAVRNRKLFKTDEPYPGEYVSFVHGTALKDYVCDLCGMGIDLDTPCVAFSIWTTRTPRFDWEKDFIKVEDENDTN